MQECTNIMKEKTVGESTEIIIEMKGYSRSRDGNWSRENLFSRNFGNDRNNRSTSNSRSRSESRASTETESRCYKCSEYDHFTTDSPTSREERELEHLQQMLNLDDEPTSLKSWVTTTHDNLKEKSWRRSKTGTFKLIEHKNEPTTFLPLSTNKGGQVNFINSKDNYYLTKEQARPVYKKVESGSIIITDTLQQEIEQEWELNRIDETSRDINPYKELIVNNPEKIDLIFGTNGTMVNTEQYTQLYLIWQTSKELW